MQREWYLARDGDKEGLPKWLSGKEPACQCRRCKRHGFDSWVWKIHGNPFPCSRPDYLMDRGVWQATDHRVSKQSNTAERNLACMHAWDKESLSDKLTSVQTLKGSEEEAIQISGEGAFQAEGRASTKALG